MAGKKDAVALFSLMTGFIAFGWMRGVDLSEALFPFLIGAGIFNLARMPAAFRVYARALEAFNIKIGSVFTKKYYVWNLLAFTVLYTVAAALLTHDVSSLSRIDLFIVDMVTTSSFILIGLASNKVSDFVVMSLKPRGDLLNYAMAGLVATLSVVGVVYVVYWGLFEFGLDEESLKATLEGMGV